MSTDDIVKIINSGGNVALIFSVYFICKAAERLARIEKALQKYMEPDKNV